MSRKFTFRNFLKDLGTRFGAAAVVVGVFISLGQIKRTDFLGLAGFLGNRLVFFASGFFLITLVAVSWILYQQSRA